MLMTIKNFILRIDYVERSAAYMWDIFTAYHQPVFMEISSFIFISVFSDLPLESN